MTLVKHRSSETETQRARPCKRWRMAVRCVSIVALAVMLLGVAAVPARAHVRVFLGFGLPVYSYPYAYSYYAYPYAPPPPYYSCPPYAAYSPYVTYGAPLGPGWVGGHWAWRSGPRGHGARVWAPPHWR